MANIIKIDNSVLKLRKRIERKRSEKTKDKRVYFLIVCEGEKTEPNYFKGFKTNVKSYIYTIDTLGEGTNTKDLVKRTIKARKSSSQDYDSVWAVFDRDSFNANNFNGAIHLAQSNEIKVAWSNEAFELWYLLHFQFRNSSMSRLDYKKAIENEMNAKIFESKGKKSKKFVYEKNSKEMFNLLNMYGNQAQAIKWAGELSKIHICENYSVHNPRTLVYLLVEELIGASEEFNKQLKIKHGI